MYQVLRKMLLARTSAQSRAPYLVGFPTENWVWWNYDGLRGFRQKNQEKVRCCCAEGETKTKQWKARTVMGIDLESHPKLRTRSS